jgi:hypothetical protein
LSDPAFGLSCCGSFLIGVAGSIWPKVGVTSLASSSEGAGVNLFLDDREGATAACISAVERVFRVVRRVGCRVDDTRPLAAERRGARELIVEVTVDVDFAVTAVMMLVSLPSSSSDSGGGEGITFRLRLGDDWTGLETGTADADRRVPAVDVRVDLTIVAAVFGEFGVVSDVDTRFEN